MTQIDNEKDLHIVILTLWSSSNWNKYQSNLSTQTQNQHLNYLIDPSFQIQKRRFGLSFQDKTVRTW